MTAAPVRFDRSPKRGDRTGPVPDVVPTGSKTTQDQSGPVVSQDVENDLRQAVERRLAERLADARRRRALRERARAEKAERRTAGLKSRHARKAARERNRS
ncbi:hypothetical protein GCM10010187_12490 [Actinomadura coerulea]|nr:hypothetical protein GCM10010187_12490 [Actinomadura coerulea]